MAYPTASVEILEGLHSHLCTTCSALARYNVYDGNGPRYACGNHLAAAVRQVATRK